MLWFLDWSFVSFCHLVVVMPSLLSTKAVIIFFTKEKVKKKKHSRRERWDAGFRLNSYWHCVAYF